MILGQKGSNGCLEEGVRSHVGTHRTKLVEIESTILCFAPKSARILNHMAAEHACWRGESNSSERLAGPGAPGGSHRGCLCRPCQLRGRARDCGEEGALQAQRCQQAATAQPRPPWPRSRGALRAPASPLCRRQNPSTPLPGDGELRAGILCSHLAPSSRQPPVSPCTPCALTATTCRVSVPSVLGFVLRVPTYGRSRTRLSSQLRPLGAGESSSLSSLRQPFLPAHLTRSH